MSALDFCGWAGAALVLLGYLMVSTGKTSSKSALYQVLNILGALFLVIYTYSCQAYASMFVNIVWAFIGLYSLVKYSVPVRAKKIKIQLHV